MMNSNLQEIKEWYGRYARHIDLPEVGEKGQLQLAKAKVLIVGAGGLGSPAALYLTAAGVGTLGIVDSDRVDLSNLQRQILHTTDRIGKSKTDSAKETLVALNPGVAIQTYPIRLDAENAGAILKSYDMILDGSDNFATRYLINDTAVRLKKPVIHGSIYRFEGQVSVFWPGKGPCYRCIYPEPPEEVLSCSQAGVLGILPGTIGLLQATEAIKVILDKGNLLIGRLLCYDALRTEFKEIKIKRDPGCPCCSQC